MKPALFIDTGISVDLRAGAKGKGKLLYSYPYHVGSYLSRRIAGDNVIQWANAHEYDIIRDPDDMEANA